ncbi:MAG TPA: flagellar basal body L-ring protein FlgH [Burkholderiaceae bacterium]|nr:flagellar basal body L-ring protein FlgH [Burkholderiaceae bacterium]
MTAALLRACAIAARALLPLAALSLGACAVVQQPQVALPPTELPPAPVVAVAPPSSNGAIFQTGFHRPLFEDHRAQTVGDLLTIQIQENTSARQRSNTSVNREGKIEGSITALPGVSASRLGRARVGAGSSNSADAKGESGSDNVFTGTIAVTVAQVLPNGNLRVVGEKQVGVNQTIDVLRFSGTVNPKTIRPGNVVPSNQVADVRVEFRGRGDIDRAMTVGWLQRFFFSYSPL